MWPTEPCHVYMVMNAVSARAPGTRQQAAGVGTGRNGSCDLGVPDAAVILGASHARPASISHASRLSTVRHGLAQPPAGLPPPSHPEPGGLLSMWWTPWCTGPDTSASRALTARTASANSPPMSGSRSARRARCRRRRNGGSTCGRDRQEQHLRSAGRAVGLHEGR